MKITAIAIDSKKKEKKFTDCFRKQLEARAVLEYCRHFRLDGNDGVGGLACAHIHQTPLRHCICAVQLGTGLRVSSRLSGEEDALELISCSVAFGHTPQRNEQSERRRYQYNRQLELGREDHPPSNVSVCIVTIATLACTWTNLTVVS